MKIYYIGQKGVPAKFGGVERHVEELTVGLSRLGHDLYVYTRPNYTDEKLTLWRGVHLISLPSLSSKYLDAITHTFRCILDLARRDVDVIHFHSIGPASLIWLAKLLKPGVPVIFTFHTQDYFHQKWGFFARSFLRFGEMIGCRLADQVIVVSRGLQKYVEKRYGVKAIYIPNGAHVLKALPADEIKKKWELKKNGYILSVSRLVRHKGIHHLIEAYNHLRTSKKLVIAGDSAHTDDYVWELHAMAADNPNIIFTGNQTGRTLSELFANAYLFVQPSESEGLSVALLEAMSFGRPVLVSDIAENLEAIGSTNFSFVSKDKDSLAKKLRSVLGSTGKAEKEGSSGQKRVKKEYNWSSICDSTAWVYADSLSVARDRARASKMGFARRFASFLF